MLASVATFALEGVESREVTVEVDVRQGLPAFTVVGLPDAAVRESRERVRAALLNSGLGFPSKRVTANLAPAYVRKSGASFDVAIAVALLLAGGHVPADSMSGVAVCGELSLGGAIRKVRGALAIAAGGRSAGYRRLIVPEGNAAEAALVDGIEVIGVPHLGTIVELLHGRWSPRPIERGQPGPPAGLVPALDVADVRGQDDAKRALEIAAAGGHSMLMVGPPGAGKTMLARRLPGILPPPTFEEAIEITKIQGIAGIGAGRLAGERPFRAPHHTTSPSGLVGGGSHPRPGEITLAHHGVLFLDELAEFSRAALESLRQPLEDGEVIVTRGQRTLAFPARVMLVAACNQCPCGGAPDGCRCDEQARGRYAQRLSGPLLDRVDIVCELGQPPGPVLVPGERGAQASPAIRERVSRARERQERRLRGSPVACNGAMDGATARRHVRLADAGARRLVEGHLQLGLSARGHDRVLRVAQTIADLRGGPRIEASDVDEALGYRVSLDLREAA